MLRKPTKKTTPYKKIHFTEYLQSLGEASEDMLDGTLLDPRTSRIENKFIMKRRMRQLARNMRGAAHKA